MELVIYTDESDERGLYYSNFYGGALVRSRDLVHVTSVLAEAKRSAGFGGEVKWGKVSAQYLARYQELIDRFFALIEADLVKVRIMFTKNSDVPLGLTPYHRDNRYQLLYYQFIKHAFGLQHAAEEAGEPTRIRINLDQMPHTREKNAQLKAYLSTLGETPSMRRARVFVPKDQIAEVRSHDHDVLQCLDVVLGAIQFRLNDKHKEKAPGARTRSKRTIAKEKLYKRINVHLRALRAGFNIGITTGRDCGSASHWIHPYRHWCFRPQQARLDYSRTKK